MKSILENWVHPDLPWIILISLYLSTSLLFAHHKLDDIRQSTDINDTTCTTARMFDANNMAMYVQNNGIFASDPATGQSGLFYPRVIEGQPNRYHALVYSSGLIIGAVVGDSLRAVVNTYVADTTPGGIDEEGMPFGRGSKSFRVYKIGTADSLLNSRDYIEWPADQGAPVDESGNPLLLGDQTLWCCFTDGYPYPVGHRNTMTEPLGAEVHMTVFGWSTLDDLLFIRWKIINKSHEFWKDAYVGIFSDCELGGAGDDLVGSDSALALVYDYNGDNYDDCGYETDIPSVGYVFLQTPIVESPGDTAFNGRKRIVGYRNLPAKAPLYYKHGLWGTHDLWGEFVCGSKYGAYQAYLRMQGLNENGEPMINPISDIRTDWGLSGDPISGIGWIDSQKEDRRFMLSSGPFNMAPGDTQTIAIAIAVGHGLNRLDSVAKLKTLSLFARKVYNYGGILRVEKSFADPRVGTISIPINLTNPQIAISSVEFDVCFDSSLLSLNKVFPTDRTENFDVEILSFSSGKIRVKVSGRNGNFLKGVGNIVDLGGKIKNSTFLGTVAIQLSRLDGSGINGEKVKLTSIPGELVINHTPDTFHLLEPGDGEKIKTIQMKFSWNQSFDMDKDSLFYFFYWVGENKPFYSTSDTTFLFNGSHFFKGDSTYRWTVSVFDGQIELASLDTFSLHVPPLQEIGHVKIFSQLDFLPEGLYFRQIELDGDFLYVLAEGNGYHLYVFQLTKHYILQLVGSFDFPEEDYIDEFKVKDGVAYCIGSGESYGQWKLIVLDLSLPGSFKTVDEEYFVNQPLKIIIQNNRLFIFHDYPSEMTVYNISDPLCPVSLVKTTVPFYIGYEKGKLQISNDLIYYGDIRWAGDNYFSIYCFNDTLGIDSLASLPLSGRFIGLTVDKSNAYVITSREDEYWGNGRVGTLNIIDVSDPENPKLQGTVSIPYIPFPYMYAQNNFLFMGEAQLDIFETNDPESPFQVGFSREASIPMVVRKPWVYCDWKNKLRILYINYPETFKEPEINSSSFQLYQNYPNPFRSSTTITYTIFQPGIVEIDIFNILGQHVATVEKKACDIGGTYRAVWDGKDSRGDQCAGGVYICRIRMGKHFKTKKIVKLQ